VVTCEIKRQLK